MWRDGGYGGAAGGDTVCACCTSHCKFCTGTCMPYLVCPALSPFGLDRDWGADPLLSEGSCEKTYLSNLNKAYRTDFADPYTCYD